MSICHQFRSYNKYHLLLSIFDIFSQSCVTDCNYILVVKKYLLYIINKLIKYNTKSNFKIEKLSITKKWTINILEKNIFCLRFFKQVNTQRQIHTASRWFSIWVLSRRGVLFDKKYVLHASHSIQIHHNIPGVPLKIKLAETSG